MMFPLNCFFTLNINFFFYKSFVKFNFLIDSEFNLYFIAILSFLIYVISISGLILNLKNLLISLFFIELAYFAIIVFILNITIIFNNFHGFLLSLIIILLAAAESAVGLSIVILIYSFDKKITFDNLLELS